MFRVDVEQVPLLLDFLVSQWTSKSWIRKERSFLQETDPILLMLVNVGLFSLLQEALATDTESIQFTSEESIERMGIGVMRKPLLKLSCLMDGSRRELFAELGLPLIVVPWVTNYTGVILVMSTKKALSTF